MKAWTYLEPGDVVDIIAPGSATDQKLVLQGVEALAAWGLKARYTQGIVSPSHPYLAQTDEFRFRDLKRALLAKDSKAVWCLRGGYGAIRLLPQLARLKAPATPKLLIGYSDITSLHTFISQKWKWSTLHAPLIDRIAEGTVTELEVRDLKNAIFGKEKVLKFENLVAMNSAAQKKRTIKATISGGNLVVLQSTLGTPFEFKPEGIVFFEEVGERGYRVDRMLVQMEQAGTFKKAKAVIFADFLKGQEPNSDKEYWSLAVDDFAGRMKIPVLKGLQAGHAIPNRPVPINTPSTLALGSSATLTIGYGGVYRSQK